MTNKMNDLSNALTAAGATVSPNVVGSDTVFANGFGIFCTMTGFIQARNGRGERFIIGTINDTAEVLAATFLAGEPV